MTSLPDDMHPKLRQALVAREQIDVPTEACLADEVVACLAEGGLEASARATALLHLAECLHCRRAVASVTRAIGDGAVTREVARAQGRHRPSRWYWVPASAGVAAALLLWMVGQGKVDRAPAAGLHRSPTIASGSAPKTLFPVGRIATAEALRWSAVVGADRYRVTLYDGSGRVVYERELTDTMTALPDSVRLAAGSPYFWRVDGRISIDRWVSSSLVQFSIAGGRAP